MGKVLRIAGIGIAIVIAAIYLITLLTAWF